VYRRRRFTIPRTRASRIVTIIIVVAIAIPVLLGVIAYFQPTVTTSEPNVTEAPWLVKTSSRIYYAREYKLETGKPPAVRGYWELTGRYYRFCDRVQEFPYSLYGKIDVIRREATK
jgi:hypothetical protein